MLCVSEVRQLLGEQEGIDVLLQQLAVSSLFFFFLCVCMHVHAHVFVCVCECVCVCVCVYVCVRYGEEGADGIYVLLLFV